MFADLHICQICLRTDRKLKVIDNTLSNFHDELCDYICSFLIARFCTECEHRLKKVHNFKTKCIESQKILTKWKKTKTADRKPLDQIASDVPPSLGLSTSSSNCKIYEYSYDKDTDSTNAYKTEFLETENILPNDIKIFQIENNSANNLMQELNENEAKTDPTFDDDLSMEYHNEIDTQNKSAVINNDLEMKIVTEDLLSDVFQNNNDTESDTSENDTTEFVANFLTGKKSLADLSKASETESSDDSDSISLSTDEENEPLLDKADKIITTLKNITEKDINPIYKSYDMILSYRKRRALKVSLRRASKVKIKRNKELVIMPKLDPLMEDLDGLIEEYNTILNEMAAPNKQREKLISEIKALFKTCGEMTTEDGNAINKDFVVKCLEERVPECMWKQIFNIFYPKNPERKPPPTPKMINLFNTIQNKFDETELENCEIEYLNTREKMVEEFERRKNYTYYLMANYKCDLCCIVFKFKKLLDNHLDIHEKNVGKYECPICKLRFVHLKNYAIHERTHEAVYRCKLCPMVTHYRSVMLNHCNRHKGKRYSCELCGLTFQWKSGYYTHLSIKHDRKHVCTVCGDAFLSEEKLDAHRTKHEGKEPPENDSKNIRCEECDLEFSTEEAHRKHVKISHNPKISYKWKRGTSTLNNKDNKKKNKRSGPGYMTCRVCNAKGRYGWLVFHFRSEHPDVDMDALYADRKTNLCHLCGAGFTTNQHLRTHINKHSNIRPYACAHCPKSFHSSTTLAAHSLMHRPRAQVCSVCGKVFRSRSNLNAHMSFHIGDRRYKCTICFKGFLHRSTLNEHIQGVHNNERRVRKRGVSVVGGTLEMAGTSPR